MKAKKILLPIIVTGLYEVCIFSIIKVLYDWNLLISINNINASNFWTVLFTDILLSSGVLIAIGFALFKKVDVIDYLKLTPDKHKLVYILFAIYVVLFFIMHNFSIVGCYRWIYYLIFIAVEEEIVYRGYLFTSLEKEVPIVVAIIISGIIWGCAHAFMPIITHDTLAMEPIKLIITEAFNGVGAGAMFVLLYKKSNTLLVPILVHAIFDYCI